MHNRNDSVEYNLYLNEIGQHSLLTEEEEKMYLRLYKENGDMEARRILIECNLRLVVSVVNSYPRVGNCEKMDMIQVGNVGLIRGIEAFEISKNCKLATYVTWWIRHEISRFITFNKNDIRCSVTIQNKMDKLKKYFSNDSGKVKRKLNIEQIAEELGYSVETVLQIMDTLMLKESVSLDAPSSDEDSRPVMNSVKNAKAPNPVELITSEEQLYQIEELLFTVLNEKEESVIRYRFGFDTEKDLTLEEVARIFGITRERIQQIEKKAIGKLKNRMDKLNISSISEYIESF